MTERISAGMAASVPPTAPAVPGSPYTPLPVFSQFLHIYVLPVELIIVPAINVRIAPMRKKERATPDNQLSLHNSIFCMKPFYDMVRILSCIIHEWFYMFFEPAH